MIRTVDLYISYNMNLYYHVGICKHTDKSDFVERAKEIPRKKSGLL